MPLPREMIDQVYAYCDRDLPDDERYEQMFDFVNEPFLKQAIIQEFKAARYIYKLMEALHVNGIRLHAHVKFQITQYASIYEAIIVYLLWGNFKDNSHVTDIEYHSIYKKVCDWPNGFTAEFDGESLYLCSRRKVQTSRVSIKFDDKVDAAVKIGFVTEDLGEEIKIFYKLRNSIHIETAIKNQVQFEIGQARLAYRRMQPFTDGIRTFLAQLQAQEAP